MSAAKKALFSGAASETVIESDKEFPSQGYVQPSDAAAAPGVAAAKSAERTLETLRFDNRQLRSLPLDRESANYTRSVNGACFSRVAPTAVARPVLVSACLPALALIDVAPEQVARPDFAEFFCGNKVLPGAEPAAHCYCGHQFGAFSGQLGDGATMHLGEIVNARGQRWELQFKGAGKTPYSRTADGRKVLRSSLREYLCSELMSALGVPSTRAGTVVTSDTRVARDVFYDGNPTAERATVITRIAPTFLRFGSFQIARPRDPLTGRAGPSVGRHDIIASLADYVIDNFYGDLKAEAGASAGSSGSGSGSSGAAAGAGADSLGSPEQRALRLRFFEEVCAGTAKLVAHWQAVGWCHGVLNTDNCSIFPWPRPRAPGSAATTAVVGGAGSGEAAAAGAAEVKDGLEADGSAPAMYATGTIDYGPFGWMERFDPAFICNASDNEGRYSYENQPHAMRWSCGRLGEALGPLLPTPDAWRAVIPAAFDDVYTRTYSRLMRRKLGLCVADDDAGAAAEAAAEAAGGPRSAQGKASASAGGASGAGAAVAAGGGGGTPVQEDVHSSDDDDDEEDADPRASLELNTAPLEAAARNAAAAKARAARSAQPGAAAAAAAATADALVQDCLSVMAATGADWTNTWRALMALSVRGAPPAASPSVTPHAPDILATATEGHRAAAAAAAAAAASPVDATTAGAAASAGAEDGGAAAAPAAEEASFRAVLAALLAQTASAAEVAEIFKPRIPPAQLGMLLMLADTEPRIAAQRPALEAELARFETYKRMKGRSQAAKDAEDAAAWAGWLRRYQAALRAEADAAMDAAVPAGDAAARASALAAWAARRAAATRRANPAFVLRNWVAQAAITKAEEGDFREVAAVLARMRDPFAVRHHEPVSPSVAADMAAAADDAKRGLAAGGCGRAGGGAGSAAATADLDSDASMSSASHVGADAPSAAGGGASAPDVPPGMDPYACRAPSWARGLRVT